MTRAKLPSRAAGTQAAAVSSARIDRQEGSPCSLRLQLFGAGQAIWPDGSTLVLSGNRPIQLVAFLAATPSWQRRSVVASLFWADQTEQSARSYLRHLLHITQRTQPWFSIEVSGDGLRLAAASDLQEFEQAMQAGDWPRAIELGRQPLLEGIECGAPPEYREWLEFLRARLLRDWTTAIRSQLHRLRGRPAECVGLAEQWVRRCPFEEEAVQALMCVRQALGQPDLARAAFNEFALRLHQQLSVECSQSLRALLAKIDAEDVLEGHELAPASKDVPPGASLFVGRRLEQRRLLALLERSDVRIITVCGMGGIGKTSLARAVFDAVRPRANPGPLWLDMAAIKSAEAALGALAAALGASINGEGSTVEQVQAVLCRGKRVVFLDGVEHLRDLPALLARLVRHCPRLTLVVTSRQRLDLEAEWLLPLDGLPTPDMDEREADVLLANDSLQLFVAAAERAGCELDVAREAASLVALVNLVEGLPLAIRLLACRTRLVSPAVLLAEFKAALRAERGRWDGSPRMVVPELAASFAHSWDRLSCNEQDALVALAWFPESFSHDAALAVTRTNSAVLTSLREKWLLRQDASGRLSLHAIIRLGTRSRCGPSNPARRTHRDYYARSFDSCSRRGVAATRRFLTDEWHNLVLAWECAVEDRAFAHIAAMGRAVLALELEGSADHALLRLCATALSTLERGPRPPCHVLSTLKATAALFTEFEGNFARALALSRAALQHAVQADDREAVLASLLVVARNLLPMGRTRCAQKILNRARALSLRSGMERFEKCFLECEMYLALVNDDHATASDLIDLILDEAAAQQDEVTIFFFKRNKVSSLRFSNNLPGALQTARELVEFAVAHQLGPLHEASALSILAMLHCHEGQLPLARHCMDRADALSGGHYLNTYDRFKHLAAKARIAADEGRLDTALELMPAALHVALDRGGIDCLGEALLLLARWLELSGNAPPAARLLHSMAQSDATPAMRRLALHMLEKRHAQGDLRIVEQAPVEAIRLRTLGLEALHQLQRLGTQPAAA